MSRKKGFYEIFDQTVSDQLIVQLWRAAICKLHFLFVFDPLRLDQGAPQKELMIKILSCP